MTEAEILTRLPGCDVPVTPGFFAPGTVFGDWRLTAFLARGGLAQEGGEDSAGRCVDCCQLSVSRAAVPPADNVIPDFESCSFLCGKI